MVNAWTPTRDEYYADPAIGSSALRDFLRSPLLFYERHVSKVLEVPVTDAMDKGSLADLMLTEPGPLDELYQVTDLPRKGTKAWKAEDEEAEGRTLVKRPLWDEARAIAEAVVSNPLASALLLEGEQQVAHRWLDSSGVTCRYRLDNLRHSGSSLIMVDLKVWSWTDPEELRRAVYNSGAYLQAALYERGLLDSHDELPLWVLVVVGQDPPHEVTPCQIGAEYQQLGRREVALGLERLGALLSEHRDNREAWLPSYAHQINVIQPPGWVVRRMS